MPAVTVSERTPAPSILRSDSARRWMPRRVWTRVTIRAPLVRHSRSPYDRAVLVAQRDIAAHFTASFTAFTGLARTALLAGFAANVCSCFVKGLMPFRAGRAGFLWTVNFARP